MNATRSEVPPETEGALITADLRRALEPRLNAELLDDFGFTGVDIATPTATNPRSVRRWKQDGVLMLFGWPSASPNCPFTAGALQRRAQGHTFDAESLRSGTD
ncbi:MAG: hypothetical protein JO262_19185 [Solirubrobacterales bacterium]|nr:hypothetical protein [Solirubrobacterales bacterium]